MLDFCVGSSQLLLADLMALPPTSASLDSPDRYYRKASKDVKMSTTSSVLESSMKIDWIHIKIIGACRLQYQMH